MFTQRLTEGKFSRYLNKYDFKSELSEISLMTEIKNFLSHQAIHKALPCIVCAVMPFKLQLSRFACWATHKFEDGNLVLRRLIVQESHPVNVFSVGGGTFAT